MAKYRCGVCGYIHEGELEEGFRCPVCKQPASAFVTVEEAVAKENIYAGTKTEKNLEEAFAGESIRIICIKGLSKSNHARCLQCNWIKQGWTLQAF